MEPISFAGLKFANPVVIAAGVGGYGTEWPGAHRLDRVGGLTLKALTVESRVGNPYPRIAETEAGMINSVGLQNDGLESFLEHVAPLLPMLPCRVIANLSGHRQVDYVQLVEALAAVPGVDLLELNVSCPNVDGGRLEFGSDPQTLERLVVACAAVSGKPLMVKLSPNVTRIEDMARAAEAGGAHALSLVNTFLGMQIDVASHRPSVARITGGYSGPGIKPIALRMVYQTCRAVKIPVLGLGGIRTRDDALEFLLAGATLVGIGAAAAWNPRLPQKIARALDSWVKRRGLEYHQVPGLMEWPDADGHFPSTQAG